MNLLKPLFLQPKYYEPIEKEIMRFFNSEIYKPLFLALNIDESFKEFYNAKDALAEAVRNGTVDYDGGGTFSGEFNAKISAQLKSLGATFDARTKTWSLKKENVPVSVSIAKANADDTFNRLRKNVLRSLDDSMIDSIFAHKFATSYLKEKYERAIEWMDSDFQKTVKSVTIVPKLTAEQRRIIAEEWTNNLKLYIRGWTKENIVNLREKVELNAFAGQRSSNMVKMIQDNYGVARNKAKFLARQETSLLLSKFREERYKDVGVQQYKWSTSGDSRVRDDHKHLDGKIFSFSQPPVVDRSTGRTGNPGEDFNCRCIARPVWNGEK